MIMYVPAHFHKIKRETGLFREFSQDDRDSPPFRRRIKAQVFAGERFFAHQSVTQADFAPQRLRRRIQKPQPDFVRRQQMGFPDDLNIRGFPAGRAFPITPDFDLAVL